MWSGLVIDVVVKGVEDGVRAVMEAFSLLRTVCVIELEYDHC